MQIHFHLQKAIDRRQRHRRCYILITGALKKRKFQENGTEISKDVTDENFTEIERNLNYKQIKRICPKKFCYRILIVRDIFAELPDFMNKEKSTVGLRKHELTCYSKKQASFGLLHIDFHIQKIMDKT